MRLVATLVLLFALLCFTEMVSAQSAANTGQIVGQCFQF